ncbi:MAG: DNA-directed RNA polymerase subunit beta' [Candidatus Nealsonbacteria bacterium]|nr:DNA-directed RNA polymerase subunit beta' [Candidatus Nealsonbacteria bacterium]
MRVSELESIRIKLASPEDILGWSHGEVTKPETINYRTQRPEKDGLFCERIFGPEKDYECYCGKYKRIRYKGVVCDRCGVEVTKSSVRRERMGHIKLATPVSHIWFLRGIPSRMGTVLDLPMQHLEKIIYFASYIVTNVNEDAKSSIIDEIEKEYKIKVKTAKQNTGKKKELNADLEDLKRARDKAKEDVNSLKPLRILSEVEYYDFSLKYGEVFEAGTGAETLWKIFSKINLKDGIKKMEKEGEVATPINRRKRIFKGMEKAGVRPEWMFVTVVPILPPDLRPMVQLDGGRYASSDLNDLYRRVINRNNRLKYLIEINAPEVIVRNEKRMLQEAVDALIDNGMRKGVLTTATTGGRRLLKSLADMLKGKQGRFRQNLLGKRVDYSGRSVIVVGPELKLHQCGLPKKMALELFKPFVIKKILEKELSYNVRGASKLIEQETDEVWAILEDIVKSKVVLLNRAPTLHRLGIQAFEPVLIEGSSIQIHPLVCKAFNADFDGDQMAVHVPLGEEAQKEARELMLASLNLLKTATGTPIVSPSQDIVLGCYWLTKVHPGVKGEGKAFSSTDEAILACESGKVDIRAKIKILVNSKSAKGKKEMIETSLGRVLFNEALPSDHSFVNDNMSSKKLEAIIAGIIDDYEQDIIEVTLDKIKELGFKYATLSGVTWGMGDLIVPKEKPAILDKAEKEVEEVEKHFKRGLLSKEEKTAKIIEVWTKTKSEIEKLVPKTLEEFGPIFTIIDSGARGSWSQPVQMAGMKGLVINPAGQIIELPVRSSFKEGFDVLEYFISTHGARKGTADTALRTSTAGYLTRKLVDVAHEVITFEEDCGDTEGYTILKADADEIGQSFVHKVVGYNSLEDVKVGGKTIIKKGEVIDWKRAKEINESGVEKVVVRSPLTCKALRGVCQKCYGWDLSLNETVRLGEAVGVVAAQAIGEPGTQLTMRTFHTGGVAGGGDITFGLPRVQEVFEARTPRGKAEISLVEGKITDISPEKVITIKIKDSGEKTKSKSAKSETVEYKIPPKMGLLVSKGDEVYRGQQLCEGILDLKEYFKVKGEEETQKYILKEIQKIYVSQGAIIHDKHVKVIIRQMFSRVKIKDSGDSQFFAGEISEKSKVSAENIRLKKEGKNPVKVSTLLLGISRVALTTDSFLSAASFQETSRVLIKAALEGKEDKLRGLKENVIIGKLIPAGTGFKK